jgi:hypothetical protein
MQLKQFVFEYVLNEMQLAKLHEMDELEDNPCPNMLVPIARLNTK